MNDIERNISPNSPITNPDLFVGRNSEMHYAFQTIESSSTLLITGDRGIGKTSFGKMVEYKLVNERSYESIWISCTSLFDSSFDNLIFRIIESLLFSNQENEKLKNVYSEFKLLDSEKTDKSYTSVKVFELFDKAISSIESDNILLTLDDVGFIRDFHGLSNFIKLNTDRFKINIVLIGVDLSRFLKEHPSIQRVTNLIVLNRFTKSEIEQFVKQYFTFNNIKEERYPTIILETFSKLSDGTPRLLHMILRLIIEYKSISDLSKISREHLVSNFITKLLDKQLNPVIEKEYLKLLGSINNKGKEEIIRYLLDELEHRTIKDIEKKLTSKYRFEKNLQELISNGVLSFQNNQFYFYDAFFKILLENYSINNKLDFNELKKITLPNK